MALLVLDAETKKTFQEVGGKSQTNKLGISVVGVYDYARDKYLTFEEHQIEDLENLIEKSDGVVGFNIKGFDWTVIQPYFKKLNTMNVRTIDIMEDIVNAVGYRVRLESVAQATVGKGKSGDGLDAIRYFREGKMEELKKYCLDDVIVTREIYDYGVKNNKIMFQGGWENYQVDVQWNQ